MPPRRQPSADVPSRAPSVELDDTPFFDTVDELQQHARVCIKPWHILMKPTGDKRPRHPQAQGCCHQHRLWGQYDNPQADAQDQRHVGDQGRKNQGSCP